MAQGGLIVLDSFGGATFDSFGGEKECEQVLTRLGLPEAEGLPECVGKAFELVRFEDGLHLCEHGVDNGCLLYTSDAADEL